MLTSGSLGQPSLPGLTLHPDFTPQLQTITMPHKKCGQPNEGCKQTIKEVKGTIAGANEEVGGGGGGGGMGKRWRMKTEALSH